MTSWHLPSVTVSVEAFNYADLMVDESMLLGGFLSHGGTALSLDGLFHGNSEHKMDVLSLPPWIGKPHRKITGCRDTERGLSYESKVVNTPS